MLIYEKEIKIPKIKSLDGLFYYFYSKVKEELLDDEIPIRFIISRSDDQYYYCDVGIIQGINLSKNLFEFRKRKYESKEKFNAVLIIPTGIGCEIGGHAGDAGVVARLISSVCDNLILHPNVVNASDINEMEDNTLYVEGSVLTRLLMGTIGLEKVRSNRVIGILDTPKEIYFYECSVNAFAAAKVTMGLECPFVIKTDKLKMNTSYSLSGRAIGEIEGFDEVINILSRYLGEYDAVAISSIINVPDELHKDYYKQDLEVVNPWGGAEAMLTHAISYLYNIPSAHAPMFDTHDILDVDFGIVDPRKSAEIISNAFIHCVLKGLHRSPGIVCDQNRLNDNNIISAKDISCVIIPDKCLGLPTLAALYQEIPLIVVKENKNIMENNLKELDFKKDKYIEVNNYLEAVGVINALKMGISLDSLKRPVSYIKEI